MARTASTTTHDRGVVLSTRLTTPLYNSLIGKLDQIGVRAPAFVRDCVVAVIEDRLRILPPPAPTLPAYFDTARKD